MPLVSPKKLKVLLDFFLWGNLPPVCLRVSPGLLRHSCGPASCHTSSMAAKLGLALTQNSSPTPLANRRRVAQIAGVQGAAPPVARRNGRDICAADGAKSPIVQSAIRRWRNPRRSRRPPSPPHRGWRTAAFLHALIGLNCTHGISMRVPSANSTATASVRSVGAAKVKPCH